MGTANTTTPVSDQGAVKMVAGWGTFDPFDPTAPALIEKSDQGFRLTGSWQVDTIEYVYGWWGLGEPGNDHQTIQK